MYSPKPNHIQDSAVIADFIGSHGFATLVTSPHGVPFASHLPVLHDTERSLLWSHMARANEQWRHFSADTEVLCIFHGPHSYISPRWYASKIAVPTWNYAVAHVYGTPEITDDPFVLRGILDDTTEKYEKRFERPWVMDLPGDTVEGMMKAVVGFSISITRVEAKFKFGQNRPPEDQESMLQALALDSSQDAKALAEFLQKQKK